MIKNILKLISISMLLCIAAGASLFTFEEEHNSIIYSGNDHQSAEQKDEDSSGFRSDGPVIIYEDGKIISYSIRPFENAFKVYVEQINSSDSLTCYIDETDQQFSFTLKESINTEKDVYDLPDKMLIVSVMIDSLREKLNC